MCPQMDATGLSDHPSQWTSNSGSIIQCQLRTGYQADSTPSLETAWWPGGQRGCGHEGVGSGCLPAILPLGLLPAGPSAGSSPACYLFPWEAFLPTSLGPAFPHVLPGYSGSFNLRMCLAQVARQQGWGCPALPAAGRHFFCIERTYNEDNRTCDSSQVLQP